MEFNLSPSRIGLFVACLAFFWLLGGFEFVAHTDGYHDSRRVAKAWGYCIAMFVAGAGCVSLVDHLVGTLDRSNIRLLYIIVGIVLMVGSYGYLHMLKSGVQHAAPE